MKYRVWLAGYGILERSRLKARRRGDGRRHGAFRGGVVARLRASDRARVRVDARVCNFRYDRVRMRIARTSPTDRQRPLLRCLQQAKSLERHIGDRPPRLLNETHDRTLTCENVRHTSRYIEGKEQAMYLFPERAEENEKTKGKEKSKSHVRTYACVLLHSLSRLNRTMSIVSVTSEKRVSLIRIIVISPVDRTRGNVKRVVCFKS